MNNDICIKLGERVRRLRKNKALTQDQLAEKAGISTKYLQNLEGKTPKVASIITLEKIAKAFKMTPSQLINF